jgi:superfamily II DNA or RNA helicase
MTNKFKLQNATISDKIYFKEKDLYSSASDVFYEHFNYKVGDEFVTTWSQEQDSDLISIPSGAFFKINFENLIDERPTFDKRDWTFNGKLKEEQQQVADKLYQNNKLYSGLVKAPCGWGKSFLGAYLIAQNAKPTIIILHTKLLAEQWYSAIQSLIPDAKLGFIGDGRCEIGDITIAIYKSLLNQLSKVKNLFEVVIVDEAHLCPADTFSRAVNGLNARVKIALSATPVRKDGLHIVLPDYFGPNRVTAIDKGRLVPAVEIIRTDFSFRVRNPMRDWAIAINMLAENDSYIDLICSIAKEKIAQGRCLLIVGERIELLKRINAKLEGSKLLVGVTKKEERNSILLEAGKSVNAILSTKIFDEGISCHRLDTIIFTCPQNNYAKLEQRIGRILRNHEDKKNPLIIDIWLSGSIVKNTQEKRLEWYRQQRFKINPL